MPRRITVVVSQGQSNHPAKRKLEEDIVANLLTEQGVDVTVVPHLYDLVPESSGMLCLSGITGDMIVCSWFYPRAACWTLDRNGIRGVEGKTLLKAYGEDEDDDEATGEFDDGFQDEDEAEDDGPERVADRRDVPQRTIFCLDLRSYDSAEPYVEEIKRIAREAATQVVELTDWIGGSPKPEQMERYLAGSNPDGEGTETNGQPAIAGPIKLDAGTPTTDSDDQPTRRWYPVIDFGRCTNCMECIDFCLFGVYGVDARESILVEQPDNCRKGCPACSRVCPENAIIFPQHKTPTIAGSPEVAGVMKIDLSQLFGAPDPGAPGAADAVDVAARERDEQLLMAGREAVGKEVGIHKRQADRPQQPKDELDQLMDQLDELDL